jgi:hypothetical protein
MPDATVCYAGSAGREFQSENGERGALPLSQEQRDCMRVFNERLAELLEKEENRVFAMIGSGVQYKYGQTTVRRQDIHRSIAEEKSNDFAESVAEVMRSVDPEGRFFRIADTGKDLEIILTVRDGREFHKGDGAAFLDRELQLDMGKRNCLICGDTDSDVAMVEYAVTTAGADRTWVVFVTDDPALQQEVRSHAPEARFMKSPDALVTALNNLSREQ